MFKITVLYNTPENPAAFDAYYKEKHIPLVDQIEGQATVDDLNHFATGGVSILIGSTIDNW